MRSLEALNVSKYVRTAFILLDPNMWNTAESFSIADISIRRVTGLPWWHKEVVGAVHVYVCKLSMYLYNTIHEIYLQSIQVLIYLY